MSLQPQPAHHPQQQQQDRDTVDDIDDDDVDDENNDPTTTTGRRRRTRTTTLSSSLACLEEIEISHEQAMQSFLTTDKYTDIELQASDGIIVRANRAMLAARSPMFDRMLYGNFAERNKQSVTVSYTTGNILTAMVQYIYRDDCDIFHQHQQLRQAALQQSQSETQHSVAAVPIAASAAAAAVVAPAAPTNSTTSSSSSFSTIHHQQVVEWIKTIVAVFDAAKYFLLPGLCRKAQTLAQSIMDEQPSTAGVFFATCDTYKEGASDLEELALQIIARDPISTLLLGHNNNNNNNNNRRRMSRSNSRNNNNNGGRGGEEEVRGDVDEISESIRHNNRHTFRCMSSTQLQKILMYPKLQADEHTRFLLLHSWANVLDTNDDDDDDDGRRQQQQQQRNGVTAAIAGRAAAATRTTLLTTLALPSDTTTTTTTTTMTTTTHGTVRKLGAATTTTHNDLHSPNKRHCASKDDDNDTDEQQQQDDERSQRRRQASQLTKQLHLEQIDPMQLSSIVSSSGLVTTEQFCHAYQAQALLASYFPKPRTLSWSSSKNDIFDCNSVFNHSVELLHCRKLRNGIHKWSIKLECTGGNDQYLGVAACHDGSSFSSSSSSSSSSPSLVRSNNHAEEAGRDGAVEAAGGAAAANDAINNDNINNNNNNHNNHNNRYRIDTNQWLGSQLSGWVYGSNGSACHAMGHNNYYYGDRRPVFDQGSVITFVLDLTPNTAGGGGTLSASVGGLPACQLFTNMLSELPPEYGFVPAISLRNPGRVRFLGFDVS